MNERPGTRAVILETAAAVFARRGYTGTTIGDLAEAAGVTRPTVYAYFDDKDAVFRALAERARDDFLTFQQEADTVSVAATLRSSLVGYLDACVRHLPVLLLIARQALTDPGMRALWHDIDDRVTARHERYLERITAAGLADPAPGPSAVAEAVAGIALRFAARIRERPELQATLADDLVGLHRRLAGVHPDAARRRLEG